MSKERDLCRMYDTLEAYGILREQMLVVSYEFSEELPFADPVFSFQGDKSCTKGCVILGATILSRLSLVIPSFQPLVVKTATHSSSTLTKGKATAS